MDRKTAVEMLDSLCDRLDDKVERARLGKALLNTPTPASGRFYSPVPRMPGKRLEIRRNYGEWAAYSDTIVLDGIVCLEDPARHYSAGPSHMGVMRALFDPSFRGYALSLRRNKQLLEMLGSAESSHGLLCREHIRETDMEKKVMYHTRKPLLVVPGLGDYLAVVEWENRATRKYEDFMGLLMKDTPKT